MLKHTLNQHEIKNVAIGIQARSTSKRFPNKISEEIAGRPVVMRVIDAAIDAARYLNNSSRKRLDVSVNVLIPHGDPARVLFGNYVDVYEGDENDVLSRYANLQKIKNSDYVVRITADCPLIPPFIISKLVTIAVMNGYDYLSNADERFRTSPDGFDCEVISKRCMAYLNEMAKGARDREHVTTLMRNNPPDWLVQGFQVNFIDLSGLKISIDTKDDLERVRDEYTNVQRKLELARAYFGKNRVHQF